ncbi:MAG TPA: hypothetical protein VKU79_06740, partial [Thermoplasmataceae archaeon]|nr:hypothetical protein [Thermoplasmataceae archaeon]
MPTEIYKSVKSILQVLVEKGASDIDGIKVEMKSAEPILPIMLWLNSMNFVTRRETSTRHPILRSQWSVTQAGNSYLEFIKSYSSMEQTLIPAVNFVSVIPPQLRQTARNQSTDLAEALTDILSSAKHTILISSPYIDETLVTLLRDVPDSVSIKILTEDSKQPMFVRLSKSRSNVQIRTLKIMKDGIQL